MNSISVTVRFTVQVPADVARDIDENWEEYSTQGFDLKKLHLYARGGSVASEFVEYETENVVVDE